MAVDDGVSVGGGVAVTVDVAVSVGADVLVAGIGDGGTVAVFVVVLSGVETLVLSNVETAVSTGLVLTVSGSFAQATNRRVLSKNKRNWNCFVIYPPRVMGPKLDVFFRICIKRVCGSGVAFEFVDRLQNGRFPNR